MQLRSSVSTRLSRARGAIVVLAVLALLAGCSSGGEDASDAGAQSSPAEVERERDRFAEAMAEPVEERTIELMDIPGEFTQPDTRGVRLPGVPRRPGNGDGESGPPPLEVLGGSSTLQLHLIGPGGGPVGDATVRIERFAEGRSGAIDRPVGRDGTLTLEGLQGGRYRVRAWRAPDLTALEPQTFFMRAGDEYFLRVGLLRRDALLLRAVPGGSSWVVDDVMPVNVLVLVESVDPDDGIVRGEPLVNEAVLRPGPGTELDSGTGVVVTGGDGRGRWLLRCTAPGRHAVTVSALDLEVEVVLPECTAPVPETPTDVPPASLVPPSGTSPATPTTTTTTAPPPTTTSTTVAR